MNVKKRLMVIEIEDESDIFKDFKTDSGYYDLADMSKHFKCYTLNPNSRGYFLRAMDALGVFFESKEFTRQVRDRLTGSGYVSVKRKKKKKKNLRL